jgi:hypothetical protein
MMMVMVTTMIDKYRALRVYSQISLLPFVHMCNHHVMQHIFSSFTNLITSFGLNWPSSGVYTLAKMVSFKSLKLKITMHSHVTYQDDSITILARVYIPDDG